MKNEITLQTRREFLRSHGARQRAVLDRPGVSRGHLCRPPRQAADSATQAVTGRDSTIWSCSRWPAAMTASTPSCPTPTIITTGRARASACPPTQVLEIERRDRPARRLTGFKELYDAGQSR